MARGNQKARQPVKVPPARAGAEALARSGGDKERARGLLYESAINQLNTAHENTRRLLSRIAADLDALPAQVVGGLNEALRDVAQAAEPNGESKVRAKPLVSVKPK